MGRNLIQKGTVVRGYVEGMKTQDVFNVHPQGALGPIGRPGPDLPGVHHQGLQMEAIAVAPIDSDLATGLGQVVQNPHESALKHLHVEQRAHPHLRIAGLLGKGPHQIGLIQKIHT